MTKLWDPESPSVRLAIVCYADILGFRAQTRDAFTSGTGEDFLRRIKTSLKKAYDIVRRANDPCPDVSPLFEMKVFTDNIVVAYPLHDPFRDDGEGELGTIMMLFAQVQASLASDGFFLRGAIAYGEHYQDDDVAYGMALLEAVGLEESGGAPRLVIARSVEPLIDQQLRSYGAGGSAPHFDELLEDQVDDRLYVNYLGSELGHFPDYPIHLEILPAHRDSVLNGLRGDKGEPRVRSKYEWLADYHNYVCRTFAERNLPRGDEYADPEQEECASEAQRALEFLIPLEAVLQSPRPLDSERLRRRVESTT